MKSNQKLSLLFWHRKSKSDNAGFAPVICRISIDSRSEEFSIGKKVHVDHWDAGTKKAVGGKEAKAVNQKISSVATDMERHFTVLQMEHSNVTPLMVKNAFLGLPATGGRKIQGQPPKGPDTLLKLADLQIGNFEKMVEKQLRSYETLKQWRSTRKKLSEFVAFQYGTEDLELQNIGYSFATDLYRYLTVERTPLLQEAAAKKQIKNTKQLLTLAETENFIPKNPIQKFRCGGDETDITPLEYTEIITIWNKRITIQRLEEVRDVFIFQCFTGFAFQDVYALSEENIVKVGVNGEKWLMKDRGKTGVKEMVPVMPVVEEIIRKYDRHPCSIIENRLLPVNSNARHNGYLKEIAVICGIKSDLNTHLARHSFADMMLNVFGFSLEEVSKMLGHKTIRTTQRYAKVRKQKISQTWARVKNIVFDKDGKLKSIAGA